MVSEHDSGKCNLAGVTHRAESKRDVQGVQHEKHTGGRTGENCQISVERTRYVQKIERPYNARESK